MSIDGIQDVCSEAAIITRIWVTVIIFTFFSIVFFFKVGIRN